MFYNTFEVRKVGRVDSLSDNRYVTERNGIGKCKIVLQTEVTRWNHRPSGQIMTK